MCGRYYGDDETARDCFCSRGDMTLHHGIILTKYISANNYG